MTVVSGAADNALLPALRHLTLSGLAHDLAGFLVIWVAIVSIGMLAYRLLSVGSMEPWAEFTVSLGLGITGYGALLVAIGFLPLLHELPLTVLSLISACSWFWIWPDGARLVRQLAGSMRRSIRSEWIIVVPALLLVAVEFLAGFRPPFASDEVAYHWAAPLLWASHGHWVTSPYRFTNGFNLAETVYTTAAVFRSSTAAHWTDTMTLVVLASGTAALAQRFKGLGALSAAAAIAIPAATVEAHVSYNDIFAACLVLGGCVVVADRTGPRTRWTCGILLAGAISVKPITVLLAPLPVLLALSAERRHAGPVTVPGYAGRLVPLVVPVVIAAVGWFAYSLHYVHRLFQTGGLVLARFGHDPSSGLVTLRLPTLSQALAVPLLPIATGIIGEAQPYGGRTSLVLVVFIPVMIVTAVKMEPAARRQLGALALPTLIAYLIASVLIVRTRFLLVDDCAALAAASIAVVWWERRSPLRYGPLLHWGFRILILAGFLDVVRHTVSG